MLDSIFPLFCGEGRHTILAKKREKRTYKVEDDLAVGLGLEVRTLRAQLAEGLVVIDLAVDGKDKRFVVVGQGLGSRF